MHQDKLISVLKTRRDSLRLTQESLAEMSGVNLRTLKQFESGKGNPTLATLQKLADIVGMEVVLQIKKL
jgi:transcriptional regulator with XRE-family HTH domain